LPGLSLETVCCEEQGANAFLSTRQAKVEPASLDENVKRGGLHIEIVPADQPGCHKGELLVNPNVPGLGRCSGRFIPLPRTGQHVRAVGAYVLDTNHDWREIHPAWKVTVVSGA